LATCELALWTALLAGAGCSVQAENGSASGKPVTPPRTAGPGTIAGLGSCASAGCHGRPFNGITRNWTTAYSVWLCEDPHRRAFEVLYSERSVEMYRNLQSTRKPGDDPPDDASYLRFLERRCIGCHATERPNEEPAARGSIRSPSKYLSGVHCESCHGAASGWLHEHYLTTWPQPGTARRASLDATGFRDTATGFRDTKNLRTRAAVCVGCHVGPQIHWGGMYDVNHDLIAAGHPRLTCELDAYLENYPQHWDAADDVARHRKQAGDSFHVDAWRFGQEQIARQLVYQVRLRIMVADSPGSAIGDFSNYECFDCHHALGAHANSGAATRRGMPRPALAALENFEGMQPRRTEFHGVREFLRRGLHPAHQQVTAPAEMVEGTLQAIDAAPLAPLSPAALSDHARLLASLLKCHEKEMTFDQAVQFYLAVQALARDLPDGGRKQELKAAADELFAALSDPANFGSPDGPVTQYDSPAHFRADKVAPLLSQIRTLLGNYHSSSRPGATP
jgi:hypothetical protein